MKLTPRERRRYGAGLAANAEAMYLFLDALSKREDLPKDVRGRATFLAVTVRTHTPAPIAPAVVDAEYIDAGPGVEVVDGFAGTSGAFADNWE